ncbi:MAG: AAA family ATPase [Desulfamplus sp.]|nr:AAA family ATPase [Desulfamplus sp.]
MRKRILYAEANYAAIVLKNGYFVDKTEYIAKLENVENPVFLRPRRFGKSLLCTMLEYYYSVLYKDQFDTLFGHTWIGKHPTRLHNSLMVLHLDFSTVETGDMAIMERSFNSTVNLELENLIQDHGDFFKKKITIHHDHSASENFKQVVKSIAPKKSAGLYVIIDEYDNFANQLITGHKDHLYKKLMADEGFLKTFFKQLKEGRKSGAIRNVFITGVLPVTMDELASGFNIATFITLNPTFENMLGFTQMEVDTLIDEIYRDYGFDTATRSQTDALIKSNYNGYHFVNHDGEALYNSTILIYFLNYFTEHGAYPRHLTDLNMRTDLMWVKRLTGSNAELTNEFVEQLITQNSIAFDDVMLTHKFNLSRFFEKDFFPVSFFYLGMLTRRDDFTLKLPNLNMRRIFVEYFNELNHIDISTRYADIMHGFVVSLDLKDLFAGYWKEYVSQLPEAVFAQVNENFYRTTFFELCSRYLSRWFVWNLERSYPSGRTDLEFVGKFNECFADTRMVIEFKYFSNAEFRKFKCAINDFMLRDDDVEQIEGYVKGLKTEYPEAKISKHVIYCFGNIGYKVFDVE